MLPIDEPPLTADLIRSRHRALLARLRRRRRARRVATRTASAWSPSPRDSTWRSFARRRAPAWRASGRTGSRRRSPRSRPRRMRSGTWSGACRPTRPAPAVRGVRRDPFGRLARAAAAARPHRGRGGACVRASFLQVNVTGEATKAGFALDWFEDAARRPGERSATPSPASRAVSLAGLMTIGPAGAAAEESRRASRTLRRCATSSQQLTGRSPCPSCRWG